MQTSSLRLMWGSCGDETFLKVSNLTIRDFQRTYVGLHNYLSNLQVESHNGTYWSVRLTRQEFNKKVYSEHTHHTHRRNSSKVVSNSPAFMDCTVDFFFPVDLSGLVLVCSLTCVFCILQNFQFL